jgi:hypothetical protein
MLPVVSTLLAYLATWFRSRHSMQLEFLVLHHQVAESHMMLAPKRPDIWRYLS